MSRMRVARTTIAVGIRNGARRAYSAASSSSSEVSATMRSGSVPVSRAAPAYTASGRSVFSRSTSTGLPSEGASS